MVPSAHCRSRSTTTVRWAASSATSATPEPYVARYDDLVDGQDTLIDLTGLDVSLDGVELQDREFVAAIREGREPDAAIAQVMPCYRTIAALEEQLAAQRG